MGRGREDAVNADIPAFAAHADPAEAEAFDAVVQDAHAGNAGTGVTREVEAADSRTSAEGDAHGAIAGRAHAAHTEADSRSLPKTPEPISRPLAATDAADAVAGEAESAHAVVIAAGPAHADSPDAASDHTGGAADETGHAVAARLRWSRTPRRRSAAHLVRPGANVTPSTPLPVELRPSMPRPSRLSPDDAGILDAAADHTRDLDAVAFHAGNIDGMSSTPGGRAPLVPNDAHASGGVTPDTDRRPDCH